MMKELMDPAHLYQLREDSGPKWKRKLKKIIGNATSFDEFTRQINFHFFGQSIQGLGTEKASHIKATKITQKAMAAHRTIMLPLNWIAAGGAFVGSGTNVLFNAMKGKHITNKQYKSALWKISTMDKKQRGLVELLEPRAQSMNRRRGLKLSMSAKKYANSDNLFFAYRKPDELWEDIITGAMSENYGIDENGEPKKLSLLPEGSPSIYDRFQEEGEIKIDGLSEEGFVRFRKLIMQEAATVKGGISNEDIMGIRTSILGQAAMQYKNWLPAMFKERFKKARIDDTFKEVQIGRYRVLTGELTGGFRKAKNKIEAKRATEEITMREVSYEYLGALLDFAKESTKVVFDALPFVSFFYKER